MSTRAPQFIAGLLDTRQVSRSLFDDALVRACPAVAHWCARDDVPVTRSSLAEAVIAALPQAMQRTWRECLAQADWPSARASDAKADFYPRIDVFGRPDDWVVVPLAVGVHLERFGYAAADQPACAHATLTVAIDGVSHGRVAFHRVERDLAFAPGLWR